MKNPALLFSLGLLIGVAGGMVGAWLFAGSRHEIFRLNQRIDEGAAVLEAREAALQARIEEIGAANTELEAFVYSVARDLRAPLRHVVGFASLLGQHADERLDETGQRYSRVIMNAAAQIGHLVDGLLNFSRMSKAEMLPSEVDLNALVADVVVAIGPAAGARDVAWTIHSLPRVRGDQPMLRVALMNVVSNAVKYTGTRAHAEIEIGSRHEPTGATVLYVRDNGVGFDMASAGKLFGVFQRLHGAEEFEGTGTGLASVRQIMRRHGGEAWAEAAPDLGATFYMSLPDSLGA